MTSEEVAQLLNTYFSGTAVSIYREGDNAIPIVLRAGAYTSQSLEGLTSATFAKNGELISLAQVARLKPGFDLARIRRKNQERTITVTARSTSLTAGQLACDRSSPACRRWILPATTMSISAARSRRARRPTRNSAAGFPIALGRDGAGDHPAVQFVPPHASDLHEHTADPDRHPLRPFGGRDNRSRSSAPSASSAFPASSSTTPSC